MKKLALILPIALSLAACGEEPAPEPTAATTPAATPSLPATDQALFSQVFSDTCEGTEPVNTAVCRRAMGSSEVSCQYGLGDDTYRRNKAMLTANEDNTGWMLKDPESVCGAHGASAKKS